MTTILVGNIMSQYIWVFIEMKIVLLNVKNRDSFISAFEKSGYEVEPGPHTVLSDHSELTSYKIVKNGEEHAIAIMHFITQYYRAELKNTVNDDEYLEELLRIKYSGEKWGIPVSPVIVVVLKEDVLNIIENYSDDYPVEDGEKLVNTYRRRNPGYENIPRILLARILEDLGKGSFTRSF